MNKYIKDNKVIMATEKAYNSIYKLQGYIPFAEKAKRSADENTELKTTQDENKSLVESLNKITKENEILKAVTENKNAKAKTTESKDNK